MDLSALDREVALAMGWADPIEVAFGRSAKNATEFETLFKVAPPQMFMGKPMTRTGIYKRCFTRDGTMLYCGTPHEVHRAPSVTRDWSAFGEALLWAAGRGLAPMVRYGIAIRKWNGSLGDENGVVKASEYAPDPRVALALAIAEWRKGR